MTDTLKIIIYTVSMLFFAFCILWFTASQEAKSYRKFCDRPVTTWDAIWLDLRIDECKKVISND